MGELCGALKGNFYTSKSIFRCWGVLLHVWNREAGLCLVNVLNCGHIITKKVSGSVSNVNS